MLLTRRKDAGILTSFKSLQQRQRHSGYAPCWVWNLMSTEPKVCCDLIMSMTKMGPQSFETLKATSIWVSFNREILRLALSCRLPLILVDIDCIRGRSQLAMRPVANTSFQAIPKGHKGERRRAWWFHVQVVQRSMSA